MGRSITLEQADAVVAACRAAAADVGQPMNIAVCDDGGNLVAFAAMDATKLVGNEIARQKALTAVHFQADTRDLAELVQPGAPLFGIESTSQGRLVVFGGGVVLRSAAGELVGGVGVSAGTVEQDHLVAAAGRDAFPG